MPRPQVSIRLATAGKAQVQKDFAEIADAGGAQAARLRSKWESETQQIERMTERAAKTAQRLATVTASPVQQRIGASVGIGAAQNGAARAAAAALAQELDRAENEARQLLAAIDPLFAAQTRYAGQISKIKQLKSLGVIDEQRYIQLLGAEESALDAATRAATRHAHTRGAMRMGMQQFGFQLSDIAQGVAMDTKVATIFAQQSGQVVQSLQLMGGEGNKFLKFIGGPWGIALSVGAVALTPLIGKLFATKDGVDALIKKMKEEVAQGELNLRAEEAFARSAEGVAQAIRDATKARKDSVEAERTSAERANIAANANLREEISIRNKTKAQIDYLRALVFAQRQRATTGGPQGELASLGLTRLDEQLKGLGERAAAEDALIAAARAELNASRADLAEEAAGRAADPSERIKRQYADLIKQAKEKARAEGLVTAELTKQMILLKQQEAAALKAAQESSRNTSLPKVTRSEVTSLLKDVFGGGTRITSTDRTPAQNKRAGGDANSYHLVNGRGFATDFVPAGGMGAFDRAAITAAAEAAGLKVLELLGPGDKGHDDHGHLAVAKARLGPDQIAAAQARRTSSAETAAARQIRNDNVFDERMDGLNQQLLQAQGEAVLGAQAQAEHAITLVRAEQLKVDNANLHDAEEKKIRDAQAKLLILKNDEVADQRVANIERQNRLRTMQEQDQAAEQLAGFEIDRLEHVESLARTAGEHRRLQLEILDLAYQEKQRHLETLKAQADLAGNIAEAARIQAEINNLPAQRARETSDVVRRTRGPGEEYLDRLPQSIGEINEAIEGIAVDEIDGLSKSLAVAILEADSLGDVFENVGDVFANIGKRMIAQIIEIGIQMLLIKPLANSLFGGGGGFLGGLFGGGFNGASFNSTVASNNAALAAIPFGGNAVGTQYFGGGSTWVGENGRELLTLPRGSKIAPAAESRRLAANDSGMGAVAVHYNIDARGADTAAVARLEKRLDQMAADIPRQVIATWTDAVGRNVLR